MGKELQASLVQLKTAAGTGGGKGNQALQQMQGKVANMQNAFKGGAVKKSTNIFAMASTVVAVLSTLGMIGLFVSYDDSAVQEAATLGKKVKKLEANEEFYLGLKRRLEDENKELVEQERQTRKEKEEIANNLSNSMTESQNLRGEIDRLEDQLSEAKDDLVRAQKVEATKLPEVSNEKKMERIKSVTEEMLAWAKKNTTLVYPLEIEVLNKHITLQDRAGQVQIPVKAGGKVRAMQVHPASPEYLVVAQQNSDKFMATILIKDSTFLNELQKKYQAHNRSSASKVNLTPLSNTGASSQLAPLATEESQASVSSGPSVIRGAAMNPQKPENVLDSMPAKSTAEKKVDTSDHGANCVCKDCRVKKIGKGSLFPDL